MENTQQQNNIPTSQQQLLDFTQMFKTNGPTRKFTKALPNNTPNWLLEIPSKINLNIQQMQQRRYINMNLWNHILKFSANTQQTLSQQFNQKLLALIVTSINYLYHPSIITLKSAQNYLSDMQFPQNYIEQIPKSIHSLLSNSFFKCQPINFQVTYQYNQQQSQNILDEVILKNILDSFKEQSNKIYFLYTYPGQFYPIIGFQNTPLVPLDAYKKLEDIQKHNQQMWLIMSTMNKFQQSLQIKRWRDIKKSLTTLQPQFYDLKNIKKGIQNHKLQGKLQQSTTEQHINTQPINKYFIIEFRK